MKNILVIVHPGSACGSADFNLEPEDADECRDGLAQDILEWNGAVIVIDSSFSDELRSRSRYRDLGDAIEFALRQAEDGGHISLRAWGCDNVPPHHYETAARLIAELSLSPSDWTIELTGAWYDPSEQFGCVNSVEQVFRKAGFQTKIRESAVPMSLDAPEVTP